jgi:peptidoglycan/LPS O-acetylase OafA/YrhL
MTEGTIMNERVEGYDFIRSVAILVVFFSHILNEQASNEAVLLTVRSLSPGITMSLLGFISAAILSAKEYEFGTFLVKRFTRIYISLALCLVVVIGAHAFLGKNVITQHTLLHFMGLSAFFDLFLVKDKSTIGAGLWYITAIITMYLIFPLLIKLFKHRQGFIHLLLFIVLCTAANFVMYGTSSTWNVVISFSLGVYLGTNGHIGRLVNAGMARPLLGSLSLLSVAAFSAGGILPYGVRGLLFALYPLAFVPLLFAISKKLPPLLLVASGFFAGLSYEFYILHFYLINEGFRDFFPGPMSLAGQIIISFTATFGIAFIVSRAASWFRKLADRYLLAT